MNANVHFAAQQLKPDCLQQAVKKNSHRSMLLLATTAWPGGKNSLSRHVFSFGDPLFEHPRQAPYGKACRITLELQSHGNENWHAPGSTDVHDSHGLMFITLLVDTSCYAVTQILHMQIRLPGLSNGASLATAIPESPRRPLHI